MIKKKRDELIAADKNSAEIIKPILRGRDIKRYAHEWAGLWIIGTFPALNIDIEDYPAVRDYLKSFGKKLHQTGESFTNEEGKTEKSRKKTGNKWFETQDQIAYYEDFEKEKVVWKRIGSIIRFLFDDEGFFCQDSTCIMTGKNTKYLTAVLNSKVGYYLLQDSPRTGTGDLILSVQALNPILIPKISSQNQNCVEKIEALVREILAVKKDTTGTSNPEGDTAVLEAEIDELVFDLYELTAGERKIVLQA